MKTLLVVALMVALLALGGCTSGGGEPLPAVSSGVAEPRSRVLARVAVTREGDRISFSALWTWGPGRRHRELVMGDGASRDREPAPREADLRAAFPAPEPATPAEASAALGRLLPLPVTSLQGDTRLVIGGGDGATLLPFQKVAVSRDHDDWWAAPLPLFDGARAYVSGAFVARDGRLLALLDHFSDDRAGRPAERHHGLWRSTSRSLTRFTPFRPRFVPPLSAPRDGWGPVVSLSATRSPSPVVWVTTWDQRLYVSTDSARTFHEVDAR